jgi:hypothetical protein
MCYQGKDMPDIKYMTKTCRNCGKEFQRPSKWVRVLWCSDCQEIRNEQMKDARRGMTKYWLRSRREPIPCADCGGEGRTWHHIVPVSMGGKTSDDNLVFLCWSCHSKRHEAGWYKSPI